MLTLIHHFVQTEVDTSYLLSMSGILYTVINRAPSYHSAWQQPCWCGQPVLCAPWLELEGGGHNWLVRFSDANVDGKSKSLLCTLFLRYTVHE